MHLLLRVLPAICLVSCASGDRAPTLTDLCRSEMAVPSVPPDTAAGVRALERALADSLSARFAQDSVPMNVYQLVGFVVAWPDRHGVSASPSDMLTALALAEVRGLMEAWYFPRVVQFLGAQQSDGPGRVWSLLGVPPAECVLENCSLQLIADAANLVAPGGGWVSDSFRSPYYRGAFCRLVTLYTDSTWPTPRQAAPARASERSVVINTAYRLLEPLTKTGSKSDVAFVGKALRAARASGDLGREIAEAYDVAMGLRRRR